MDNCGYCGDELLPAHRDFGICNWCVKAATDNEAKKEYIKVPSYSGYDFEEHDEEEDNLPTPEEYM